MTKPKRWNVLNWFIDTFKYQSYLEIGCYKDVCFNQVKAKHKVGVDPIRGGTHRMTSDEFFLTEDRIDNLPLRRFDIGFVDGLHHAVQVLDDVNNLLRHLSPNGVILIHDCLPAKEEFTVIVDSKGKSITSPPDGKPPNSTPWHGDVWKAMIQLRQRMNLDCVTLNEDCGIGIILNKPNTNPLKVYKHSLSWKHYRMNRISWLNVQNWKNVKQWASSRLLIPGK